MDRCVYLLRNDDSLSWERILKEHLTTLRDIKLIIHEYEEDFQENNIINHFNTCFVDESISSEWPAVIYLHRFFADGSVIANRAVNHAYDFSKIYLALSRARVYAVMILYNYKPNLSEFNDKLLSKLRQRGDVCKIIESNRVTVNSWPNC